MTDPLMPAFCCKKSNTWTLFYDMVLQIDSTAYNSICLVSATFGILGATYQILPQLAEHHIHHWYWISSQRTRKIILWLAVSDLLASVGIFCRSIVNLFTPLYLRSHVLTNSLNCYLISSRNYHACMIVWNFYGSTVAHCHCVNEALAQTNVVPNFKFCIQYFYVVSWFWTLIYAIDMWLALKEKPSYLKTYHILAWILPAIFTIIGLYILYFPADRCFISTENSFWKFLPNYLVSYLPLLAVMIINPVLYYLSSASIPIIVSQYLAQYTNKERHIVDMIKIKFGLINLTFYVCWLPNIVNAVVIFTSWNNFPDRVIVALWYIMAIFNPLQAFFNSMVYGKPATKKFSFWGSSGKYPYNKYPEKTPLLLRRHTYSTYAFEEPDIVL